MATQMAFCWHTSAKFGNCSQWSDLGPPQTRYPLAGSCGKFFRHFAVVFKPNWGLIWNPNKRILIFRGRHRNSNKVLGRPWAESPNNFSDPQIRDPTSSPTIMVKTQKHREAITSVLLSTHLLAVEVLRYIDHVHQPVPYSERICRFCMEEVETPEHTLITCTSLDASWWNYLMTSQIYASKWWQSRILKSWMPLFIWEWWSHWLKNLCLMSSSCSMGPAFLRDCAM
jgi:hypothetical protein